ncbi:MAG: hypothetical protein R3E53_15960 [Myxococcota bacterium]
MELLTVANAANLGVLIFLQAVLGFDNLLYISIESRAPVEKREQVRRAGILIALVLRIVLLFVIMTLLRSLLGALLGPLDGVVEGDFTFATIVFSPGAPS